MATPPLPIPALLRRQAGVVSRAQALRAGLRPQQIDRLLTRRRWVPLHPRVYLARPPRPTDEARLRAAVLWAGDGAVPVGLAALWWHGLVADPPDTIALAVPHRCPARRPGIRVHQRGVADLVTVRGLTVPVRPLALLDAAVEAGPAGPALLRALGGHVGRDALHAVAGQAIGGATAGRLLTDLATDLSTDVSCTPPAHRVEQCALRNRYS